MLEAPFSCYKLSNIPPSLPLTITISNILLLSENIKDMATHSIISLGSLLLFSLLILAFSPPLTNAARFIPDHPPSTDFIKTSCSSTTYPTLCYSSLFSYASKIQSSPMQLAHTALSVSLGGARSMSAYIKNVSAAGGMTGREPGTMKDCVQNVRDAMKELQASLSMMRHLGGRDFDFQINTVQTWVSAALTDDDTCLDGFGGSDTDGAVKNAIRGRVVSVAQLTSNALALINSLASRSSP